MSFERLQNMGRLHEQELKARELRLRIGAMIEQIRLKLDPFEDIENLETDIAAQLCIELARLTIDYKGILDQNKAIKKALGK
ncbi:MAG TPA: hypothetical protein DDZ88_16515 [Verrucomicrobiales bacterium]|nr:hypothetical protein [Verrucomicrobiales bacterium]